MATRGEKNGKPVIILALDLGTGGLTGQYRDEPGTVLAEATADYGYGKLQVIADLPKGVMLQHPDAWEKALAQVAAQLKEQLAAKQINPDDYEIRIGLDGQMHGLVTLDKDFRVIAAAPLWCDDRDADEAFGLTSLLGVKVAQRFTLSRLLGLFNRDRAIFDNVAHITTPGGYIFYLLTGILAVGAGEASGMAPVDSEGKGFDTAKLKAVEECYSLGRSLADMLPLVCRAGQFVAGLNDKGAELLGLPLGTPVAPVEGDQQAAMAGSLVGRVGDGALSLGNSFVLNTLAAKPLEGYSAAIDPFKDAFGLTMLMCWVKNGANFLDMLMEHYRDVRGDATVGETFAVLMPEVEVAASEHPDCQGLLGVPFINNEPGAGFASNCLPFLAGMNVRNFRKESLIHLAHLMPLFGIKNGMDRLEAQGLAPNRLILTGGVTKSPTYIGQTIANVCGRAVFIPDGGTEGSTYGAFLLALYADRCASEPGLELAAFLDEFAAERTGLEFKPEPDVVAVYARMREQFNALMDVEQVLANLVGQGWTE